MQVTGVEDFLTVSKRLKAAGNTGMRKDLNKRIKGAAKPLVTKSKQVAATTLPQRGGLAREIARRPMRVKVATGRNPGVSIVAAKTDPRIDEGRVAHPVFGRRPVVIQQVRPGFFSATMQGEAPYVRGEVIAAIQSVVDEIAGG